MPPAANVDGGAGECSNGSVSVDLESRLRALPSVDQVLQQPRIGQRINGAGRALVVAETRAVLERLRAALRGGLSPHMDSVDLLERAEEIASSLGLELVTRHTGYGDLERRLAAIMEDREQPVTSMTHDGFNAAAYPVAES